VESWQRGRLEYLLAKLSFKERSFNQNKIFQQSESGSFDLIAYPNIYSIFKNFVVLIN
jgi:hypothetical protein